MLLPFLLLGLVTAGHGEPAACLPLNSDWIYGRDLAAAVPALTGLPPDLPVSYAPVPGLERVFRPPELRQLARAHRLPVPATLGNACFAWPVVPLAAESVRQAIETTLAGRNPQIEIAGQSLAPVPKGELIFPLAGLSAFSGHATIWKGYVRYTSTRRFSTWANVRIAIREPHLVAAAALSAGVAPAAEQIRAEPYQGPLLREMPLTDVSQLTGLVACRAIASGVTLLAGMFEAPKEVERGDLVTVLVENGAAHLETQGIADQAGRRGDIISVHNPRTGRPYRARIAGRGTVLVVPGGPAGLVVEDKKS